MAIPHNFKYRYGERGAADAKPKAQAILCAAKVSAASGGYSEPKQGQRSQSARGFCSRSTMRVPQPDIIEHFGNADAVPQPPERRLCRQTGIVRCCHYFYFRIFGGKNQCLPVYSGIKKMSGIIGTEPEFKPTYYDESKIDKSRCYIEYGGITFLQLGDERTSTTAKFTFR